MPATLRVSIPGSVEVFGKRVFQGVLASCSEKQIDRNKSIPAWFEKCSVSATTS